MSERLGPIDVVCDAPPYLIVQACRQVGIRTPEDVRWYRRSQFLSDRAAGFIPAVDEPPGLSRRSSAGRRG